MNDGSRLFSTTALAVCDLALLAAARPDVDTLAGNLAAPRRWVAEVGADAAALTLAGAALWVVALWLAAGLLAALAATLPGSCGQLARAVARVLLPSALYRVVAGAAGLGVLLAPVAAGAAANPVAAGAAANPVAGVTRGASSAPPIPTPTWPADPPPVPTPGWPTTTSTATPGGPAQGGGITVRPGDSLWGIAAARIGLDSTPAQTAAAWPRWYAANRAVIGADPDLIKPGQRLAPPTGSSR